MQVIYQNHLKEEIDLNNDEIILQNTDIFKWEYKYTIVEGKRAKSVQFKREPTLFNLELLLLPSMNDEFVEKINYREVLNEKVFQYTHKDVVSEKKGRLYFGEYYIEGVVIGSEKVEPLKSTPYHIINLKFLSDNPNFIKENVYDFDVSSGQANTGLDYNYDYKYHYTDFKNGNIHITRKHFTPSEFKLSIYGAVTNPRIMINDNVYSIKDEIAKGEIIEVSSKDFTIVKRQINGEEINIFDKRDVEHNIFNKISGGNLNIAWSGNFGFELVIYEERSEYDYSA